jgi:hypothetical protein
VIAYLAAAAVAVATHPAAGGGTCVDVTFQRVQTVDTLCPPRDDLDVRTLTQGGYTVYFGAVKRATKRVTLTFAHRTVHAHVHANHAYGVAVRGSAPLGAVAARNHARDVDPFGLPGPRKSLQTLVDESQRQVRLLAASPHVLTHGTHRSRALCIGLQIAGAPSPGRTDCAVSPRKFDVRFSSDCANERQLVFGVGPATVTRAVATLSDGSHAAVDVRRVPARLHRPGVVLTRRFEGAQAVTVRGYAADGKRLTTAVLAGGCA